MGRPECICSRQSGPNFDCQVCYGDEKAQQSNERQSYFPGTASMYASQHKLAVTTEWMRGWNACLDEIDILGGFNKGE